MTLTVSDMFAGWGGSTGGLFQTPGLAVIQAGNHNPVAVEAHALNYPDTDHDCADLSQVDPRRWPTTDILWASPSCTHHSNAQGRRRGNQPSLFDRPTRADEEAERSRATMWDVVRFAEHHRYRAIIVENVVEVRSWVMWPAWLQALDLLGYAVQVVYLNSMFADRLGPAAPQSRDRLYVVCWRTGDRAPDLHKWTRPVATCGGCGRTGAAVQAWKRPDRRFGKYGRNGQYVWRCSGRRCLNAEVFPTVRAAADAIDFTLDPGEVIGERTDPLTERTRGRIADGIRRYGPQALMTPCGGTWRGNAIPAGSRPMPARTTRETDALVTPPLLVPVEGRDGVSARPATVPLRTMTTRAETALVVPPALVFDYNGPVRPVSAPLPTQTTVEGNALIDPAATVDLCRFRMLSPEEVRRGMAFPDGYQLMGTRRQRFAGLGAAVTPPAARDLGAAVVEAITGEPLEVAA